MTNKECFELMIKYGGEKSIVMAKEMIHVAGVETCVNNIIKVYQEKHPAILTDEFKEFIRGGVLYIEEQMKSDLS